ncbi:MAG: hypothetical protein OEV42_10205 [Deltaproteobacteria bacterium]|nr:hypothetical protein [Deltaproteobacteria bacterium]
MSYPILFALLSTLCAVTSGTIQRAIMRDRGDVYALIIFNDFFACLFLAAIFGLPEFSSFSLYTILFFAIGGFFWGIAGWANLKSSECLDLNTSAIIGKFKFIVLTLCGIIIFNESLSSSDFIGILLIIIASLSSCDLNCRLVKKGSILKILAVLANTAAIANEKMLSSQAEVSDISFMGFFFSGLMFFALYPQKASGVPKEVVKSKGMLILVPILKIVSSLALITALKLGTLGGVIAICQLDLLIVFIFGIIFLKENTNLRRKGIASGLCLCGGLIVNFG